MDPFDPQTYTVQDSPAPYEERLRRDTGWALNEGGFHFENSSMAQQAMRKICARLEALGIDYAVAGGMALTHHGHVRFTKDVDILVTRESKEKIHEALVGLGYQPVFPGSKNLRDTELGVKIDLLITGGYAGDGKPHGNPFPDPIGVAEKKDGIRYVNLVTFLEMKIASGMTASGRLRDLADAQDLMKSANLPLALADQLHEFVRGKYIELWNGVMNDPMKDEY